MSNHYIAPQLLRVTVVDIDDSGPQQFVHATGLSGHDIGKMVRSHSFGLSTNPPAGAEGHALVIGGGADRMFALGLEHPKHRPVNTPVGGGVLYDSGGNVIRMFVTKVDMDFGGNPWTVECKGITIVSNGDDIYIKAPGKKIYLGVAPYFAVETTGGPSTQVFAGI